MAIQITYYLYQNESQSHTIIKIRRNQIETLDLEIRTIFSQFYSIWVSDIKMMIKSFFIAKKNICSLSFVTNPLELTEFILMETSP